MKITGKIRFARLEDVPQIIELCQLHAQYEKTEYSIEGKASRLSLDLFSRPAKLHCLVVENEGLLIGYATYMKQYSTWDAREYIYLDCLYLRELARGLRIGEKIVKRIQEEGKKFNCSLVQWQTPDFNFKAVKFYRRLGATSKDKLRFFLNEN